MPTNSVTDSDTVSRTTADSKRANGSGRLCRIPGIPFPFITALLTVSLLAGVTLPVWLVTFNGASDSVTDLAFTARSTLISTTRQLIVPYFEQTEAETLFLVNFVRNHPEMIDANDVMREETCLTFMKLMLYFLNSTSDRLGYTIIRNALNPITNKYNQIQQCGVQKYTATVWISYGTVNATKDPVANYSALQYPPVRLLNPVFLPQMNLLPLNNTPNYGKVADAPVGQPTFCLKGQNRFRSANGTVTPDQLPQLVDNPCWEGQSYFSITGRPTYVVYRFTPTLDGRAYFSVLGTSDVLQFSAMLKGAVQGRQRLWMTLQRPDGQVIGISHGKAWTHSDRPYAEWTQSNRSYYSPLNSTDPVIRGAAWQLWESHGRTWDLPDVDLEFVVEKERWLMLSTSISENNRRVRLYLLQDRESLMGGLDRSFSRGVKIFAGLLVAGTVVGVVFAIFITLPLHSLGRGIRCIASAEFQEAGRQLRHSRSVVREVRQLESAFAAMSITLEGFSSYVPLSVVQRIIRRGKLPKLGMEERQLTVAFVDIAGFTELTAELPAVDVVLLLGETLGSVSAFIGENEGVVDKYIGDCVMALWNAPEDVEEHAAKACAAAVQCIAGTAQLSKRLQALGLPAVKYRIGVASGPARVGNVGCAQRFNYTAVGDTVNVAARLEAANKHYGSSILVTASVQQQCADKFGFALFGPLAVVGRPVPVVVYGLLGTHADEGEYCQRWNSAMRAYHSMDFAQARERFRALPHSEAQQLFLRNCESFTKRRPPDGWVGTETQGSK